MITKLSLHMGVHMVWILWVMNRKCPWSGLLLFASGVSWIPKIYAWVLRSFQNRMWCRRVHYKVKTGRNSYSTLLHSSSHRRICAREEGVGFCQFLYQLHLSVLYQAAFFKIHWSSGSVFWGEQRSTQGKEKEMRLIWLTCFVHCPSGLTLMIQKLGSIPYYCLLLGLSGSKLVLRSLMKNIYAFWL